MSKYSAELKLEIIKKYQSGKYSSYDLEREYNISHRGILEWVHRYELHGIKGLKKNQKASYSGDFKKYVVEYIHANNISCRVASNIFNLSHEVVYKWYRIYSEEGPGAFYKEQRGRKKKMSSKPKKKEMKEETKEDLIAEVQRLRAENAYLKKLRALVQERIQQEQKKK